MPDYIIYENPANKVGRIERENAQLRSENARLREQLGMQTGAVVESAVVSQAPRLPAQQQLQHGACSVTIGQRPVAGQGRAPSIPSLDQGQQSQAPSQGPQVSIYNAEMGQQQNTAPRPPPRRMVNGQPAGSTGAPGGGGMMEFSLAAMRPTPVKPKTATPPAQELASQGQPLRIVRAQAPEIDEALDEARQRFANLELDLAVEEALTQSK